MSGPLDEFGDSLSEMFASTLEDASDMPELEQLAGFSSGPVFRQTPSKFTDTHLVALVTKSVCAHCQTPAFVGTGYALRRLHHSRNACVEFQAIMPFVIPQYDDLPRMTYLRLESMPFCIHCAGDYHTQRTLSEGENV